MPQNKNLTQICFPEGWSGKNGVINAGKKALTREINKGYKRPEKREVRRNAPVPKNKNGSQSDCFTH
ncbi:MAG: hypothetical protein LBV17_09225 [Treponema sp.]|jgi:hypothetical protein|nr:hypothetical protein [Treponema sp.]